MLLKSRTLTVAISRPPAEVYHFVSNPANLPDWAAAFCKSIEQRGDRWFAQTDMGSVAVRFVEQNPYGVLDHYVTVTPGVEIYVPMRVVNNGGGSEVLFTLQQGLGMSDERFAADGLLVERDLQTLKRVLEG